MRITFETTKCGRCGGQGVYCGGTCWGCNGTRTFLTRIGRTARNAYESRLLDFVGVTADSLIPGNVVRSKAWGLMGDKLSANRRIEKVEEREGRIVLTFTGGLQYGYSPDDLIRLVHKGLEDIVEDVMKEIASKYAGASLN